MLDDDVTVVDVCRVLDDVPIQEAVVLVAQVARLVGDGDLLGQASAQRVGAGYNHAIFYAQLQEGIAHGVDLRQEVFVGNGDLAILVAALLLVGDLVFELDTASARLNEFFGQ